MPTSKRKESIHLARHAAVYGLANVFNRAVAFIMLPIYTRFLSPQDYGLLEILYLITTILGILIGVGVSNVVTRFYYDSEDPRRRDQVISTAFWSIALLASIPLATAALASRPLTNLLLSPKENTTLLVTAIGGLYFDLLLSVWLAFLRAAQRSTTLLLVSLARLLLQVVLNIVLLLSGWKVMAILASTLIANSAIVLLLAFSFFSKLRSRISPPLVIQMLKFGLPLIPSNLASYLMIAADRYFLKSYHSLAETGLYSLGYKFGTLVHDFVTVPFRQIWTPRRLELHEHDLEALYGRLFTYFSATLTWTALAISLLASDVIRLMTTREFWPAAKVVPIIALAHVFMSFYYHFDVGVLVKKRTELLAYVNVGACAVNLTLNAWLVPRHGAMGAAYATLVTYTVRTGALYFVSSRLRPVVFEWRRIGLLIAVAVTSYWLAGQVTPGAGLSGIALRALVVAAFPLALLVTGFFDREELRAAWAFCAKLRGLTQREE